MDGGSMTPGEIPVLADVTAAVWSPNVFDDVTDLNVEGTGSEPAGIVYLRFPPIAGTVNKATLRLHTHTYPSAAGGTGAIYGVDDTSWDENTLTWGNRPPYAATAYGVAHPVSPDSDVDWDVTELVAGGTVSFALVSTDADGAHYQSKEAGPGTHPPRLLVDVTALPDGGVMPDGGGSGGSSGSGGSGAGGSSGSGAGGGSGTTGTGGSGGDGGAGSSTGCSCAFDDRSASDLLWLGALCPVLALLCRRRRDPRRCT